MQVEILDIRSEKSILILNNLTSDTTIGELKVQFHQQKKRLYPDRQSFRLKTRGPSLKDSDSLQSLGIANQACARLYFKDLGPQIGWTTVFLCEYAGPLLVYLLFYLRPGCVYDLSRSQSKAWVVDLAAACWTGHYVKRLLETLFVHRFSHNTMPWMNLIRNCGYYWGFAAFVAYFVNHPLYTAPSYGNLQIYGALAVFLVSEIGNLSIHLLLRDLRPAGSKERRIPLPKASNPLTGLFYFVSCPNYFYEAAAWLGFSVMTQCLPALLFTAAGFYQMSVWALAKHRNYRKEFPTYPKRRRAILPFLL